MRFAVIYEVDFPRSEYVSWYAPPDRRQWTLTECGEGGESNWDYYGEVNGWRHRKWVATLTKAQFAKFADWCELTALATENLGSLGAPGLGPCLVPAIAFERVSDCVDGSACAYVTPIPEIKGKPDLEITRARWERIRGAVLGLWGG